MGRKLREDKTCRNCQQVVEKRFCPNCGQENIEENRSFHHLFSHFVEDLVHYDSSFWKTVKALLFRPGRLTIEYLAGRRRKYVPPVKLYIFISFLVFFLPNILPGSQSKTFTDIDEDGLTISTEQMSANDDSERYPSIAELDSIAKASGEPVAKDLISKITRKIDEAKAGLTHAQFRDLWHAALQRNIPKAIFLFLPVFAFNLWLFHGKRRWFYFDHGIFTLHYFSFLLLTFSMVLIFASIATVFNIADGVRVLVSSVFILWWIFYFFRSHRRFYMEPRWISRLKCSVLFFINMLLIGIFGGLLLLYSVMYVK